MPRDLFGDVHRPSVRVGSRSRYTVPLSLAAHAAVIGAVGAAAVLGPVVLPGLASSEIIYTAVALPPAPPPPASPAPREPVPPRADPDAAPLVTPEGFAPEPVRADETWADLEAPPGLVPGASGFETLVAPPPPPPPPPAPPAPVRPGAGIRAPAKVHDVAPTYPVIAREARVQGVVIVEATIGVDGTVEGARVLRSIPLLDEAALTAVRQWRYSPTLHNGRPVPVVMTVTVNFQLR